MVVSRVLGVFHGFWGSFTVISRSFHAVSRCPAVCPGSLRQTFNEL